MFYLLEELRQGRCYAVLLVVALLIGFATTASAQLSPQDYTQWRGRNRDGSASAFSEPKSWPASLKRRWKVVIGEGYATPIVVGKTVYTFTRREGKEIMMALSADKGKIRWQTGYPAPYTVAEAAAAHGAGPKAT